MRIRIFLMLLLLPSSWIWAQQEQSILFQQDVMQSSYANPAQLPDRNIMIKLLPSTYFNLANTGFSYNDLIREEGDTAFIDPDQVIDQLQRSNYLQQNLELELFALTLRFNRFYVGTSVRLRQSVFANYPRTLLQLGWQGNTDYVGQTVDIGPDFQANAFAEISVLGGWHFNDTWSFGARAKYLVGLADVSTDRSSATLFTDPDIYQLTLNSDYRINTSGVPIFDTTGTQQFNARAFRGNGGFAMDVGATYQLNKRLHLGASLTDIGFINWTDQVNNYYSNGEFQYDGVDIAAIVLEEDVEFDAILDTLQERFRFVESQNSYRTWLPAKLYLHAHFQPVESIELGALLYNEFYKGQLLPAFTLSARKRFKKFFSAGATYSIRNRRFDNIGANMQFSLGFFQFYLSSDNLLPILAPFDARNTNIHLGVNFNFGEYKYKKGF